MKCTKIFRVIYPSQKSKITLEIAAKFASVNGPLELTDTATFIECLLCIYIIGSLHSFT
jgi:hypothetical protein